MENICTHRSVRSPIRLERSSRIPATASRFTTLPMAKLRPNDSSRSRRRRLRQGKKSRSVCGKRLPGTAIPYPAGLALVSVGAGHDRLLVANNLSDNVVLLDVATGKALQSFDLSTSDLVPSSFPYTCVATRDGRRAWCSLWNASRVAELDLTAGKVVRWIKLQRARRSDRSRLASHGPAAESG